MVVQIVSGPIPAPPNDGLRAARGLGVIENPRDPLDPNSRWRGGYAFDSHVCDLESELRDPCEAPNAVPKGAQRYGDPDPCAIMPFIIVAGRTCSTWGWQDADYEADANRLLTAVEYQAIAKELWRGDYARDRGHDCNPYLAKNPVNLVTEAGGDPLIDGMAPSEALASLEDWISSECIGSGIIHATTRTLVAWAKLQLIVREGGRLFTVLGTQIIADKAYDGSGPVTPNPVPGGPPLDGQPAAADRMWAYATCAPVVIRIDTQVTPLPGEFSEAVDRKTNTITYRAEKMASVAWTCDVAATAVTGCC